MKQIKQFIDKYEIPIATILLTLDFGLFWLFAFALGAE